MYPKFIKMLLPLPSFFEVSFPSDEEPNVFPATVGAYLVPCPICQGKTIRYAQTLRRFRHGYAWHLLFLFLFLKYFLVISLYSNIFFSL